jgi:hypothetical protein
MFKQVKEMACVRACEGSLAGNWSCPHIKLWTERNGGASTSTVIKYVTRLSKSLGNRCPFIMKTNGLRITERAHTAISKATKWHYLGSQIHKLSNSAWNKEEFPQEWKDHIAAPIYRNDPWLNRAAQKGCFSRLCQVWVKVVVACLNAHSNHFPGRTCQNHGIGQLATGCKVNAALTDNEGYSFDCVGPVHRVVSRFTGHP